jgi:hypothetical protein
MLTPARLIIIIIERFVVTNVRGIYSRAFGQKNVHKWINPL